MDAVGDDQIIGFMCGAILKKHGRFARILFRFHRVFPGMDTRRVQFGQQCFMKICPVDREVVDVVFSSDGIRVGLGNHPSAGFQYTEGRQQQPSRDDLFADPVTRIMRLNEVLFSEFGFRGNTDQYFDARNSFLNDVLDRRTGIPITLSVVYLEVARRIELPLVGVGLPGHFLVKYDDGAQEILLDPFHSGRLLTEDDCRAKIAEMYQGEMRFHKALLAAVSKRQILLRMLRNLKGIYAQAKDHAKTLSVIERLLLLAPEADTELRDRGLVHFGLQRYAEARADLEAYLRRAPQASDAKDIKDLLAKVRQRQAQLN